VKQHDFYERLNFSERVDVGNAILPYLYENIPGATDVVKANEDDDRNGTDYWILRDCLPPVSVDLKNREYCPIERWGADDACIETCSVYVDGHRKKVGWTLDHRKRTDLIVYTWPNPKGRRFWILHFPLLCAAASKNWQEWAAKYREKPAQNNGYKTLSVYVPRVEIARTMKQIAYGVV